MNKRKKSSLTWMFGVVVLVANALLHVGVAYAQFGSASVLGYVKDTSGAVLPGVTIEAVRAEIDRCLVVAAAADPRFRADVLPLRPDFYATDSVCVGWT